MAELKTRDEIRELVRERYAESARAVDEGRAGCCSPSGSSCGCGSDVPDACGADAAFGAELYRADERAELPDAAKLASLGCGNPTAVADLNEGDVVLDLGSGGGIDVLLSAGRVGATGKAYGLDMTDEMLELARRNKAEAGVANVEFLKGTIERIPLPDDSVDVIISNCVINLSGDKAAVFNQAARVLRPGGRLAVTDVVADPEMDEETRRNMAAWTGCVAGALTEDEFRAGLAEAGFDHIDITETHRVHEYAGSAIIRATLGESCT
jgi:arsenite methyltransferase